LIVSDGWNQIVGVLFLIYFCPLLHHAGAEILEGFNQGFLGMICVYAVGDF
jgi:hypothetical protein